MATTTNAAKVWFITGTSSGFGRLLAEFALRKGDKVVATLRKPPVLDELKAQYTQDQLLVLQLDVTVPSDITAAFAKAIEVYGRIDVVYNNAAYGMLSEVEGTSESAARALFDVDFWGLVNVSREAVRIFREVNPPGVGGFLLNISSIAAMRACPGVAYYSAAKHAVEGFTQGLAGELDPEWNIKVTLVEFGRFLTEGREKSVIVPAHPAYTKPTLATAQMRAAFSASLNDGAPPASVAMEKVYALASLANPPLRIPIGQDALATFKAEAKSLEEAAEKFASWSEGFNGN